MKLVWKQAELYQAPYFEFRNLEIFKMLNIIWSTYHLYSLPLLASRWRFCGGGVMDTHLQIVFSCQSFLAKSQSYFSHYNSIFNIIFEACICSYSLVQTVKLEDLFSLWILGRVCWQRHTVDPQKQKGFKLKLGTQAKNVKEIGFGASTQTKDLNSREKMLVISDFGSISIFNKFN